MPLHESSSPSPQQESLTTVSVAMEVDALAPTSPSASVPRASSGSCVNLVGVHGWSRGSLSAQSLSIPTTREQMFQTLVQ